MPQSLGAQGKITSDPNAPGKQATTPKEEAADARLSQKITYDSGYKRLHAVIDDLSRMSGVDILCGQGKKDWQVRDIPVVVCVKDLPLGKLLRAIADATHTRFASEKIGDSLTKSYRIYRRSTDQDRLDTHVRKRHESSLEAAAWQWDALTAYGKSNANPPTDPSLKETWVTARLIAGLGSDSKDKLLNGDTLTLRGTDPANRAYMEEYYRHICEKAYNPSHMSYPSFEKMEEAPLGIKLVDNGVEAEIRTLFQPEPISSDNGVYIGFSISGGLPDVGPLQDKVKGLPPRPQAMPIPSLEDDMANPALVPLSNRQHYDTTSDSFLMDKITLEKPPTAKDFTFAKAVRAVAQAGQCNIVTEDFTSQKAQKYQRIDGILSAHPESTIRSLLDMLDGSAWFVSEDDRLIVGWQNGRRQTWRDHHANLLPEEYLNALKTKLNGDGLELEDAVHLSNLPETSAREWVVYSDDFSDQNLYQWNLDPAWRLYDALVPEDKQLAKSSDGLPLGKFDSTWIADFFHAWKMGQHPSPEHTFPTSPGFDVEAYKDNIKQNNLALTDPSIISTMIMRIQKQPAKSRYAVIAEVATSVDVPEGLNLSSYEMSITYTMNGERGSIPIRGPHLAFPILSSKREAEMLKARPPFN